MVENTWKSRVSPVCVKIVTDEAFNYDFGSSRKKKSVRHDSASTHVNRNNRRSARAYLAKLPLRTNSLDFNRSFLP